MPRHAERACYVWKCYQLFPAIMVGTRSPGAPPQRRIAGWPSAARSAASKLSRVGCGVFVALRHHMPHFTPPEWAVSVTVMTDEPAQYASIVLPLACVLEA